MPLEPGEAHQQPEESSRHGRLAFRLAPPVAASDATGLLRLDQAGGHGLGYVPPSLDAGPMRLVVLLHGAGGSARQGLELLLPVADEHRLLLVAPKSELATWDVIVGGYGPDVARIDALLEEVTSAYPVSAVAVGGFSDGASYALSLAIGNGDVVDAAVAFSPGFTAPLVQHGRSRLFISHGSQDRVLPIDRCSRRLVPQLQQDGYPVAYEEFDGGHAVPEAIVRRAADWLSAEA